MMAGTIAFARLEYAGGKFFGSGDTKAGAGLATGLGQVLGSRGVFNVKHFSSVRAFASRCENGLPRFQYPCTLDLYSCSRFQESPYRATLFKKFKTT